MNTLQDREPLADTSNPMGIEGIEYIEYRVSRPQALGQVLELVGFKPIARHRSREELGEDRETGVLPTGRVLKSPDGSLQLQLIEPDPLVTDGSERLQRVALGAPDVPAAAAALKARGVHFVETQRLHVDVRGALTQSWLGGLMFELIHVDA